MRALFGLVGILIVLGIIVWWLGPGGGLSHTENVLKTSETAKEQMAQIGGRDTETHMPAGESAILEPQIFGGKLDSVLVTKVVPGGAYEKYFGLKTNDSIIAVESQGNEMKVKDFNDSEMATAQVLEAYSKNGHLVVMRDGQQIRLPPPAQKNPAPKSDDSPLQRQLDAIQQMPGR